MKDHGPLPDHLVEYWGNRTDDPRDSPNFCAKASRRYPAIPWHNGIPRCLLCGRTVPGVPGAAR